MHKNRRRGPIALVPVALLLLGVGCGDDPSGSGESGSTGDAPADTDDGDDESTGDPTEDAATESDSDSPADSTTGTDPTDPTDDTGPGMLEPGMPPVTGTCPTFTEGDLMFNPAGIEPRLVRIWMDDIAYEGGGRLQFYFHGTGGSPAEAEWGFNHYDRNNIDLVTAAGGIVVAPYNDPATGMFPWWLTNGDRDDDLLLMDEIVACAVSELGIDPRRIHSSGFSAGGMHTSKASFLRSVYLASVVIYSGGFVAPGYAPWDTQPDNDFAAMVVHGGVNDTYGGSVQFLQMSHWYIEQLQESGRFAIECDHGEGHSIGPQQNLVHQFFEDHPFGAKPYAGGLPEGFGPVCFLP